MLGGWDLCTRFVSSFTGEDVLTVYRHILVADGGTSWCLSVSVPMAKILAGNTLTVRIILRVGVADLLLTALVVVLVVSNVVRALRQRVDCARTVANGDLDSQYEPDRKDEIDILTRVLLSMAERMRIALAEAEAQAEKAEQEAVKVERALEEAAKRAEAEDRQRLGMLAVASDPKVIVASLGDAANTLAGQVEQAVEGRRARQLRAEWTTVRDMDRATETAADTAAVGLAEQARAEASNGAVIMGEMVEAVGKIDATSQQLKGNLGDFGCRSKASAVS